jgi:hypothetical protein
VRQRRPTWEEDGDAGERRRGRAFTRMIGRPFGSTFVRAEHTVTDDSRPGFFHLLNQVFSLRTNVRHTAERAVPIRT